MQVKSEDLHEMTVAERDSLYEALLEAARHSQPAARAQVQRRIRTFEIRYEVSSEKMLSELRKGNMRETAEIAEWLFWLDVLKALKGVEPGQA